MAQTITKTRLSPNVMHVKIEGGTTEAFFEYAHRDHLGSIEAVTDGNGTVLDQLAFEAFGSRKAKDWSANIPATELEALLALDFGHTRKVRGFTDHEHLDRTGFIHMNGRVYDPVLGRFLSPDPVVQFPTFSQSWNRYSYVNNAPASFTDPTGFELNDNEAIEEIVTTGTRSSTFNHSAFQTFGSFGVSNGGGVGSGGGLTAGGFGAGATAPTETESAEADESDDVDACLRADVACRATISASEYRSNVTFFANTSGQIGPMAAIAVGAQAGFILAGRLAAVYERAMFNLYQRTLSEFRRALEIGNGIVVAGAAARLRSISAASAQFIGRLARLGARASAVAGPIIAAVEAVTGDAGYSKFVLYGSALTVGVFFPGVGTAYAVALVTLDVGGALNPISLRLDGLFID